MASHLSPLSAHVSHEAGRLVLRLVGELDITTAPRLRQAISDLVEPHLGALTLDLADLTFVDLAGLRTILHAKRSADKVGAQFRLRSVNPWTSRVIQLAHFDELEAGIEPNPFPGRRITSTERPRAGVRPAGRSD
jgi:anti-sigma B factor antagonist